MIKVLKTLGLQGTFLNIMKEIYSKLIVNTSLNREKLNALPLKSGERQECPLSPYLFKIALEVKTLLQTLPFTMVTCRHDMLVHFSANVGVTSHDLIRSKDHSMRWNPCPTRFG